VKPYLFTIVIPSYNRAHFISHAIQSVIDQTFQNWELIIIDDGSTDNTKEVISAFKDKRIQYFHQENQERSAARNNGIKNANGQWICFLDSDDVFKINHLAIFEQHIEKCDFNTILYSLKTGDQFKGIQNKFEHVFYNSIHSQQVCIPKNLLLKEKYNPEISIGEDTELWMRLIKSCSILCTGEETIEVKDHAERSVHVSNLDAALKHLDLSIDLSKKYSENISKKTAKKKISDAYFGIAKHYIYAGNNLKASYYIQRSIIAQFSHVMTKHKLLLLFSLMGLYSKKLQLEYTNA
jgi:glycosyltransferase involved in cell wall biosynthesis